MNSQKDIKKKTIMTKIVKIQQHKTFACQGMGTSLSLADLTLTLTLFWFWVLKSCSENSLTQSLICLHLLVAWDRDIPDRLLVLAVVKQVSRSIISTSEYFLRGCGVLSGIWLTSSNDLLRCNSGMSDLADIPTASVVKFCVLFFSHFLRCFSNCFNSQE